MSSPIDDNASMNSDASEESHMDVDELVSSQYIFSQIRIKLNFFLQKREQLTKLTVAEERNSNIRFRLKAKNEALENELKPLITRSAKVEEHNRNKSLALEKFHAQWEEEKKTTKEALTTKW